MGSHTSRHTLNDDRTDSQVGNDNQERSAVEVENMKENPTEANAYAFGKGVDSGNSPISMESVPVTEGIIMESCGPLSSVTNVEAPNSSGEGVSHDLVLKHVGMLTTESDVEHVGNKVQDGLKV
nr:hypothetical protein CFP56_63279 [Quercus suber]